GVRSAEPVSGKGPKWSCQCRNELHHEQNMQVVKYCKPSPDSTARLLPTLKRTSQAISPSTRSSRQVVRRRFNSKRTSQAISPGSTSYGHIAVMSFKSQKRH